MINPRIVEYVDRILDDNVSALYRNEPLAQDWARVAKVIEEAGEAIAELISYTGQNPRKPHGDSAAYMRMLAELADTAMTPIYAIQHFTKDVELTTGYLIAAQARHYERLGGKS